MRTRHSKVKQAERVCPWCNEEIAHWAGSLLIDSAGREWHLSCAQACSPTPNQEKSRGN